MPWSANALSMIWRSRMSGVSNASGSCAARAPRAHGVDLGLEGVVLGENPPGPHHQPLPFGREALEAVAAIDQRDVQLTFQLGDRGGECGLGYEALLGRPGEVALGGDHDEILQLAEQHPHSSVFGLGLRAPITQGLTRRRQVRQARGRATLGTVIPGAGDSPAREGQSEGFGRETPGIGAAFTRVPLTRGAPGGFSTRRPFPPLAQLSSIGIRIVTVASAPSCHCLLKTAIRG